MTSDDSRHLDPSPDPWAAEGPFDLVGYRNVWNPFPWQMEAFDTLFEHFNQRLFDEMLPQTGFGMGHLPAARAAFETWADGHHQIVLNHNSLRRRRPLSVGAALVHEMVHLWRYLQPQQDSKPDHGHDELWATKMIEVGLVPTTTGKPGWSADQ